MIYLVHWTNDDPQHTPWGCTTDWVVRASSSQAAITFVTDRDNKGQLEAELIEPEGDLTVILSYGPDA